MIIDYYVFDPTGNITILVTSKVPIEKRHRLAEILMRNEPSAQQVGFVENGSLNMAGGEFCGNASISTAALIQYEKNLPVGREEDLSISVSGIEDKINIRSKRISETEFICKANMPKPVDIKEVPLEFEAVALPMISVDFGSIIHFVCNRKVERDFAERAIKHWSRELKRDCVGLMFLSDDNKTLSPLVYVANPPTLFWESSCASGTSAVGIALAYQNGGSINASFSEPGGILGICVDTNNGITLEGRTKIVKNSQIEI